MKKDEFYIGWSEEVPSWYRKFSFVVISSLSGLTLVLTLLWISKSRDFVDSRFDFGNETIYKGVIYEYPAPMLVVNQETDTIAIPFVNFGKSGVADPIAFFKSQMRNNLRNYEVKIRGTKIEFDDKLWLELTMENYSLLSFEKLESPSPDQEIEVLGRKNITGEIVDPNVFLA